MIEYFFALKKKLRKNYSRNDILLRSRSFESSPTCQGQNTKLGWNQTFFKGIAKRIQLYAGGSGTIPGLNGDRLSKTILKHMHWYNNFWIACTVTQSMFKAHDKMRSPFLILQQFLPYFTLGIEIPVTAPYMGTLFYKLKTAYDSGDRQAAQTIQVIKPYIDNT